MGRKPIGKTAMMAAERQRRCRARLKALRPYAELERAWAACSRKKRSRFLRSLRSAAQLLKKERRAEREWALTMKTLATWPPDEAKRYLDGLRSSAELRAKETETA